MQKILAFFAIASIALISIQSHAMEMSRDKDFIKVVIANHSLQHILIDPHTKPGFNLAPHESAAPIALSSLMGTHFMQFSSTRGVYQLMVMPGIKQNIALCLSLLAKTYISIEQKAMQLPHYDMIEVVLDTDGLATFADRTGVEESTGKAHLVQGQADLMRELIALREVVQGNHRDLLETIKKAKTNES